MRSLVSHLFTFSFFLLLGLPSQSQDFSLLNVTAKTGEFDHQNTPVSAELTDLDGNFAADHLPLIEIRDEKKVLVYTKNGEGYVHDNIAASVAALKKLGTENGFAVDASDDPAVMTEENLKQYDAIIFSNSNNEAFDTEAQRMAFQQYIQGGGGFVGIHSASGSERQWPWFWKMVGGKFRRHPPLQNFDIHVFDATHPSTFFLPKIWKWEDECYYLDQLNPDIHVLLAADLTTIKDEKKAEYPGNTFGDYFPLSWHHEFDGGRQWYTALGHKIEYYSDPDFLKHLLGGILWVMAK